VSAQKIFNSVMAGPVPAIHVWLASINGKEDVDARAKPGHDGGEITFSQ